MNFELESIIFLILSCVITFSSMMVIFLGNSVYSCLFLMVVFFNVSSLFIVLKAEFIAIVTFIVYSNVVVVLLAFSLATFTKHTENEMHKKNSVLYKILVSLVSFLFLMELGVSVWYWKTSPKFINVIESSISSDRNNTFDLGKILYSEYFFPLQIGGILLLTATIGVIVLMTRSKHFRQYQKIHDKTKRSYGNSIEYMNVPSHQGLMVYDE